MPRRLVFMGLALSLISALLGGCTAARPTKGEIKVYVAVPLSGWQADGGQTVLGGARLAAEQINARGGLLGYRIAIVPMDDEADSDVAVQVAEEIAAAVRRGERVLGIIGHYNSGQMGATLPIYKNLPLIVITPTASDPALTMQGAGNFFRVNATDAAQGPVDAEFLVKTLGAKRIALVYAENQYGQGLRDEMVKALQALGQPPVEVIGIQEAAETHADILPRLAAAQPDAIFLAGYETEGYVLLPELREAGITAPFMASDGCFLYDFIDGSGKWAEGAYVSGITPDPKAVTDEAWWKEYQKLENRNPGTYSIAGFSAMMVLAEGVKRARAFQAEAVIQTLQQIDLQTPAGRIRFDEKGDLVEQRVYIFQVRDGDFVQVSPPPKP